MTAYDIPVFAEWRGMKTNPLDKLSPELQERVVELVKGGSERHVIDQLVEPPPKGFGISISRAGLHAFVQRKERARLLAEAKEMSEEAARAAEASGGSKLDEGTLAILRQRLFESAGAQLNGEDLLAMYRVAEQSVLKREQMELAREKARASQEYLKLARERMQLNVARLALEHAEELRKLIVDGSGADGEKLHGALARLFGEKFAKAVKEPEQVEG